MTLKQTIHKYHSAILHVCPSKDLPAIDELGKPPPRVLTVSPTGSGSRSQAGRPEGRVSNQRSGECIQSSSFSILCPLMFLHFIISLESIHYVMFSLYKIFVLQCFIYSYKSSCLCFQNVCFLIIYTMLIGNTDL